MGTRDQQGQSGGGTDAVIAARPPQWQTPDQVEITRLTRQLDAGHPWLRFAEPLETLFRSHYESTGTASRMVLVLLAMAMIAITPLYDVSILLAPQDFARRSHLIQWGMMLPVLAVAAAILHWRPQTSDVRKQVLVIAAIAATWGGLTAQRAIAGYYDFHFPHDFGVIAIAATFAMARLRFFRFLPWAAAMLVGSLAVELLRVMPRGQEAGAAVYNAMSMSMMWLIGATGAWLFEHVSRSAWLRQEIYRRLAIHDTLTGLSNRNHFQAMMELLIRQAERERKPITVMLIDVDHFKAYNDRYGHVAGDECLRRIGSWLSIGWRRQHDLRARIGGEEFVAVWTGIEAGEIAEYAGDLREGIARLDITHEQSPMTGVVTASAGLIHGIPGPRSSADSLMRAADALLYAAKEAGRNRMMASFGSLDAMAQGSSVVPFGRAADPAAR